MPVLLDPEEAETRVLHALIDFTGTDVLEIGCGDGEWCFRVKADHPDWIVEGLDDTDHWSKKHPEKLRYFRTIIGDVLGGLLTIAL